ncbi:hypothetical protein BDN72DRAFT_553318 [Pluteus cervinus]|uniref:Uncharacterized protein n=1 Tax=Pluteus cervinus TaxID=181527 RepID=A0ACD3A2Y4_9AGAR|nr:hypothetical protein BDN72DRAFT_553318 [Pluteus cervinus]
MTRNQRSDYKYPEPESQKPLGGKIPKPVGSSQTTTCTNATCDFNQKSQTMDFLCGELGALASPGCGTPPLAPQDALNNAHSAHKPLGVGPIPLIEDDTRDPDPD